MSTNRRAVTGFVLAAVLTLQPFLLAAQDAGKQAQASTPKISPIGLPDFREGQKFYRAYTPLEVAAESLANSPRLDQLIKDGKIHLSLSDALMMAIENNLDVAIQRINPAIADVDILCTKAGVRSGTFRPSVSTGSSIGVTGGSFLGGVGSAPQYGGPSGFGNGTTSFDPVVTGTISIDHSTSLSTQNLSQFTGGPAGSTVQIIKSKPNTGLANFSYSQAFPTGTNVNVVLNDSRSTSPFSNLNPSLSSYFATTVTQHLMDGFGLGPNTRSIRIAKNNREVTDLVFKLQIVTTISQVQSLYWDLVSAAEDVKVQQRSLQVSEKLYKDNTRQVEIGTLAPIEVVRAEAEVAAGRQNLIVSQSNYQQLGTSMKNLILRNISDPMILTAEVIPTDKIDVPPIEPLIPVQELVTTALGSRTELQQSRIDLGNRDLSIRTTRNSMLPQVDAFATWASRGVAGVGHQTVAGVVGGVAIPAGGFFDSFGDALLGRNPQYTLGVQMSVTIRNRSAQADMAQALLEKRQSGIRMQQLENQVRVEVANAQIALQQNRARIDAAKKQRELAERSLDAEQKKFQLGASTNFQVIQAQRDLTQSLSSEVGANNAYMKSRVEMDRVTGQTLLHNNIMLEEAAQGQLKRAPTNMPVSRRD